MNKTDIKNGILNGQQFGNDAADWNTVNRINKDGKMFLRIGETYKGFTTVEKYANAILKLLNTGQL